MTQTMKKYDSYKDSGVEWIGELPSHWDIKRIKHTTYVKGRIGWQGLRSDEFLEESDSYVVTGTDFKNGRVKWDTCYQVPIERYNEDPFIQLKNDDLLITKDGTIGKIAVVKDLPKVATLNSGVFLTRPLDNSYSSEFMYWVLYSDVFKSFYDFNKSGSTIQHLYQNVFNEFKFPLPKFEEQIAITNYLDQKTTQIDDLIAKKERLIHLLEEERTAIINQAVTKGLDLTVPMKDSGIEWLGEIPVHWEITKVKSITKKIGSGVTPKGGAEIYELSGIPLLRSQNIYFDGFHLENVAYITNEIHDSMKNSQVQSGDVLLNITGGSIGRCYYVTNEFSEANVNQHVCIVRPNEKIITEFLYYILSSSIGQQQIDLCQTGGNREALNFEQLKNFFLCLPKVDEQIYLVQQLKTSLNTINLTIEKFRNEIELIKEYKTALISEVVTGKVDVSTSSTQVLGTKN